MAKAMKMKAKKAAARKVAPKKPTPKAAKAKAKAKGKATAPAPAKRATKKAAPRAAAMPSPRQQFLDTFAREHGTTMRVLRAFPMEHGAFQPHPRSQSAKRLMWTLVQEQNLLHAGLDGTLKMPPTFATEPETVDEVIATYESDVKSLIAKLNKAADDQVHAKVPFFTGPRQLGELALIDLMWMMLMDSIHHRGQLSVYLRMAGGKVPSIYGPSADEPWN